MHLTYLNFCQLKCATAGLPPNPTNTNVTHLLKQDSASRGTEGNRRKVFLLIGRFFDGQKMLVRAHSVCRGGPAHDLASATRSRANTTLPQHVLHDTISIQRLSLSQELCSQQRAADDGDGDNRDSRTSVSARAVSLKRYLKYVLASPVPFHYGCSCRKKTPIVAAPR